MQVEMVLAGLAVEFISRAPLECKLLMRLGLAAGAHALVLIPFYTRIQKFCPSWGLTNFLKPNVVGGAPDSSGSLGDELGYCPEAANIFLSLRSWIVILGVIGLLPWLNVKILPGLISADYLNPPSSRGALRRRFTAYATRNDTLYYHPHAAGAANAGTNANTPFYATNSPIPAHSQWNAPATLPAALHLINELGNPTSGHFFYPIDPGLPLTYSQLQANAAAAEAERYARETGMGGVRMWVGVAVVAGAAVGLLVVQVVSVVLLGWAVSVGLEQFEGYEELRRVVRELRS